MNSKNIFLAFFLFVFGILGFPPTSFSQSAQPTHKVLVEQIIKQMALEQQLEEAPENIRTQFAQNPFRLSEEKNKFLLQLFDKAYKQTLLADDFKTALQQQMSDKFNGKIHQWLDKPATKSVYDAQKKFYTLQGKRKRVITMYEMEQEPPAAERKKLISDFTDTTSIAKASIESSVIILRSVIEALGELTGRSFSKSKIDMIANNFRSRMQNQASQELNTQLLVMYHHVSVDNLKKFTSFWLTDAGQWLDTTITQAMEATYKSAADRFMQSVADAADTPQ